MANRLHSASPGVTVGEWRPSLLARCVNSLTALATAACLGTLVVVGIVAPLHGSSPAYALILIPLLPTIYMLCRIASNIWHARLMITSTEVVVAGVTRTHRVPLEQVDRSEPRVQPGVGNGAPMIAKLAPQADALNQLVAKTRGV